jgi:hypothetical protein
VSDVWGMLFSKMWDASFGGGIKMDLSYETIPIYEGTFITLYIQSAMRYQVEDPKDPMNGLMCVDEEFSNLCVFENSLVPKKEKNHDGVWSMCFEGALSRIGGRDGSVVLSLIGIDEIFSYRHEFDCTNNIVEYESLSLGL